MSGEIRTTFTFTDYGIEINGTNVIPAISAAYEASTALMHGWRLGLQVTYQADLKRFRLTYRSKVRCIDAHRVARNLHWTSNDLVVQTFVEAIIAKMIASFHCMKREILAELTRDVERSRQEGNWWRVATDQSTETLSMDSMREMFERMQTATLSMPGNARPLRQITELRTGERRHVRE